MSRVGLGVQTDKRPGEYGRIAAAAESHGFDTVSAYADLLYQPPLPALLEMAGATSRIRLGPACLNPYTLHPYEIAGQSAALDRVAPGRTFLGLARGSWLDAAGIAPERPVTRLEEAAAVVRLLLSGEGDGFDGEVFTVAPGTRLRYGLRAAPIPLLIGAWGPQTLALAGRIADEVKVGGSANPDLVPVVRGRVSAGSGNEQPAVVFGAVTVADEDGAAARSLARREVAMYLAVVAGLDPTVDLEPALLDAIRSRLEAGDRAGAGSLVPDDLLDRFAFSGTPDQVTVQATALFDAGVDRIDFGTPHGLDPLDGIDLLGRRVLPALRS